MYEVQFVHFRRFVILHFTFLNNNHLISGEEYLGIFVHFMKGENDDILFWPWKGNIRFTLVNQQSGPRFVEK